MRANASFGAAISFWLALQGAAQATTYSYTTIDFPGSTQTQPFAINDSGQIVGAYNFNIGFFFSNRVYSTFTPEPDAYPTGINDSTQIVGSSFSGIFLDTNGAVTIIDLPAPTSTGVPGINNLGQVVGTFGDSAGKHTYVFSNGGLTIIAALAGADSLGINDQGEIVGFLTGCFVYANGTSTAINVPGGTCIQASGINDSGQVVGIFQDSSGEHGFVDTNNVFTPINVPGAFATDAFGINDLGQIVGQYQTAPGAPPQGFLASPTPEPATMLLVGPGLGLLYALKRRTGAPNRSSAFKSARSGNG